MSNTWVPNDESEKNNNNFDLFAPAGDDNLQEVLARGSYKWTNKYTAIFAVALLIVVSTSAGIWYGHRSASTSSGISLPSLNGSGFTRSGFTRNGVARNSGAASATTAVGFAGGGFGGGRGTPGVVDSIKGKTITVTLTSDPSTPIKSGDTVSVRPSNGGQVAAPPSAPTSTRQNTGGTKTSTTSGATPAPSVSGAPQAGNGGGGGGRGFANNPELVACLEKAGVTLVPGQQLDRTDPKVAAAMQTCFASVRGGFPGGNRPSGAPAGGTPTNP